MYKNFPDFFKKTFQELNPTKKLHQSWYFDLFFHYIKQIEENKVRRLIVNIPPRSLKSTFFNIAFPAWIIGNDATKKIITVSYNRELSTKHSIDCNYIINSQWYKQQFPDTIIKTQNIKQSYFNTTAHGFRMATSTYSTLTGMGADIIILDDPQSSQQALSKKMREKTIDWYEQTLLSRLNNYQTGIIILVSQRLHTLDLSGYLIKYHQYNLVALPLIQEEETIIPIGQDKYLRKKNNILLPWYNLEDIQKLKAELGSYAFLSQYQQQPISNHKSLIKRQWFMRYTEHPKDLIIYQSWDCANKIKEHNDYSVCTTWGFHSNEGKYYLLDVFRAKLEYLDLKKSFKSLHDQYNPEIVLIEDHASGQQIIQDLNTYFNIQKIRSMHNKEFRLLEIISILEAGLIILPSFTYWLNTFESEFFSFPDCSHDDQVDSVVQFLKWHYKFQLHCRRIQIQTL